MSYNVANMGDIEDEEEDSQESRLRVCSSKEPSPEEADDPSPPSSPLPRSHSPPSSGVIKSEAVSWPSLTMSQPPVMPIPPHVLSELMSSVEGPVSLQTSSSSSAGTRPSSPPPPAPPTSHRHRSSLPVQLKSKERSHTGSFRPIEPRVSLQSPSLSLKPLPLSRLSDQRQPRTNSETRIVTSQLTDSVKQNEVHRIVLPQHPLPNVKKK